jgi:sporulation protein YhbH
VVRKIDKDKTRFDQIVRGKIKRNLKKYVSGREMIGRKGRNIVSIPIPQIELPRFHYGDNKKSGVGQGEGDQGSPVDQGDGQGQAGDQPGRHILEVELTLEELAQILGEELELPRIEPRGKSNITATSGRYTGIRRVGPESLRHFKRTFREALKRELSAGIYNPDDPVIVPIRDDKRYRSWKERQNPDNNAVIIYMMDVSGSMGKEQKDIVRLEAFWIDTWLRSQYKNIERRFIVHDAAAKEVDEHTFFHLRESGGTKISSALSLCMDLIEEKFRPSEWNIYPFHFSDGDNWSSRDTEKCIDILNDGMLPACNVFCYGQVKSAYGSGQFKKDLDKVFTDNEQVITSDIPDRDGIMDSIKDFLGKGK